jgi:formate hydrogenlyase subunit 3/multisubunit Na+/H+ antiporter MnhD subunit
MFYLGKALEMLGMTSLMVALFVGISDEHGMAKEYLFLGIGIVVFLLGRILEKQGGRPSG